MSKENVKLFYEALAINKVLQERFAAIGQKYKEKNPTEFQDNLVYQKELISLAKEAGYDFTEADLKEYAQMIQKPTTHELSEDELAAVAGGETCDAFGGYYCPDIPGVAHPIS